MAKASSWKANNLWILNCRRLDVSYGGGSGGGWGKGCWCGRNLKGEVCEFVEGLLRQVGGE